jgi:2-polyprenyl-6-methoxyphenol hydroxylase-like FAD-dependent oxidoreductase
VARVTVVGGGMAGLATALFSARRGHEVVVVERGAPPPAGSADELAAWDRSGVAQAPFAHFFKARSTRVVREEAPDLLEALTDLGIGRSAMSFGPGYENDAALDSRRLVYEGVLYRAVERESGVTLVPGSVRGYLVRGWRVTGVRLADGTEIIADLVVDAGGRRSASGRWLREAGLDALVVEEEASNRHYFTRHYRLREGHPRPSEAPIVQPLPYGVLLVFGGDNGTFSIAASLSADDPLRSRVQDPEVYERVLGAVPLTASWLEHADPVSDLHVMAGLSNRRRRIVDDGRPVVQGLALVGDTALYTNPALGHGVSLSFWMAQRLAESVERFVTDPVGACVDYEAWVGGVLGQWFDQQVAADRDATRQFAAGLRGEGFLPPHDGTGRRAAAIMALRRQDEEVNHLASRVAHLLEMPSSLRDDPTIAARVEAYLAGEPSFLAGEGPLSRKAFEALVTDR